jgi:hypothetical protein
MRRLLSLVLLAAFGLPAVAPVLALGQETESSLPACCRRNGAHHCMGSMQRPPSSAPAFSERCPSFPQPSTAPSQINSFALVSAPRPTVAQRASLLVQQLSSALHPSTHDFALYKRGPPSYLL